ncbi:MAG: hypothetical protein AB2A00_24710 [Myxococcota bacterium]
MNTRALVLTLALTLPVACKPPVDPNALAAPWSDNFDRAELGADWKDTGGNWNIKDGALHGGNGYNHPLWLKKVLPRNVRMDLDIWTTSPDGDLKVEVFGDGSTFDPDRGSYTASSYVLIFGGWRNSQSKIARKDEHRNQDPSRRDVKVVPNQKYHWTIERKDNTLSWSIDGQPFLSLTDDDPLFGPGHDHFAVGNWETEVFVDNLTITPL